MNKVNSVVFHINFVRMFSEKDRICQLPISLELRLIKPIPKVRYNLEILINGLIVSPIIFINPFCQDQIVECIALIDTGSESTIMCETIANRFSFDEREKLSVGISTLDDDKILNSHQLRIRLPKDNWHEEHQYVTVKDLTKREEYDAIIGMDLLRHYDFVYLGNQHKAWLEY